MPSVNPTARMLLRCWCLDPLYRTTAVPFRDGQRRNQTRVGRFFPRCFVCPMGDSFGLDSSPRVFSWIGLMLAIRFDAPGLQLASSSFSRMGRVPRLATHLPSALVDPRSLAGLGARGSLGFALGRPLSPSGSTPRTVRFTASCPERIIELVFFQPGLQLSVGGTAEAHNLAVDFTAEASRNGTPSPA
jgi:hypothetical protein